MRQKLLIEKISEFGIVANDKYYSVYDREHPVSSLKAGMLIEADLVESHKKPGSVYIKTLTVVNDKKVLATPKVTPAVPEPAPAKEPNWDKIALGKVRCVAAQAALQSPMVAQLCLTANGLDEALKTVEAAANWAVKYTFQAEA